jgi:hypothetical protein
VSQASSVFNRLEVGEQLGHLEYQVTPELLARFQEAVDYPEALFPHIAVEEYMRVLRAKHGDLPITSVAHQDRYFHPPIPNNRVQVTGWVRDKYRQGGRCYLVVETFTVDEVGREIVRSIHTLLLSGPDEDQP